MSEQQSSNYPYKEAEEKINFVKKIQRNLLKRSEMKKADEIIAVLEKNKEYDVYALPAFKQKVCNELRNVEENKNGKFFSFDINNLYQANKFADKTEVNKDIKALIDSVKDTFNVHGYSDNIKFAKLGDEIYAYANNMDQDLADQILDETASKRFGRLTLSGGVTSKLDEGLEAAMEDADSRMYENKLKYKYTELLKFCGNDTDKVIDHIIQKELDARRTNLLKVKDRSKRMDYINRFDALKDRVNVNKVINIKNKQKEQDKPKKEDKYLKRISNYENEAIRKFGNKITHDEINKYVLSKMLSTGNFENTVNNEYFQAFEKGKLSKKKGIQLLYVDSSGIKGINDKFGHEEGDRQLQSVMDNFKGILEDNDVDVLSNIVVKGAGNSFVVVKNLKGKTKENVQYAISNQETKLTLNSELVDTSDINLSNDTSKNNIETMINVAENKLDEKSLESKLTNDEQILELIEEIIGSVFDNEIIKGAILNDHLKKDDIINKITSGFKRIVENPEKSIKDQLEYEEKEKNKENNVVDFASKKKEIIEKKNSQVKKKDNNDFGIK